MKKNGYQSEAKLALQRSKSRAISLVVVLD